MSHQKRQYFERRLPQIKRILQKRDSLLTFLVPIASISSKTLASYRLGRDLLHHRQSDALFIARKQDDLIQLIG